MSRFSSKPKSINGVRVSNSTFRWSQAVAKQLKRNRAAKKAAATRKRNKQIADRHAPVSTVDTRYLDDLRNGLHKQWRKAKNDKPVILSCDEVVSATGGKLELIRSACVGHATDFAEYVWDSCPAVYFDEVLRLMAQLVAVNGVSYPKVLRDRARMLAFSLEDHRS
jgi:hypothetical protein